MTRDKHTWQCSCFYLFLRLRCVAAGIRTPNLPLAKQPLQPTAPPPREPACKTQRARKEGGLKRIDNGALWSGILFICRVEDHQNGDLKSRSTNKHTQVHSRDFVVRVPKGINRHKYNQAFAKFSKNTATISTKLNRKFL